VAVPRGLPARDRKEEASQNRMNTGVLTQCGSRFPPECLRRKALTHRAPRRMSIAECCSI
jgi:hypothetical protein